MRALLLPDRVTGRLKPFDLSSLRPGGASHLLNCCEDSEMVRRRGRWATRKTMEIYLQEVLYITYVEKLPERSRETIRVAAAGFPDLLRKAQYFTDTDVPCAAWYHLLKGRRESPEEESNGSEHAAFHAPNRHGSRDPNQWRRNGSALNLSSSLETIHRATSQGSHPG
eukprot:s818_g19.t1